MSILDINNSIANSTNFHDITFMISKIIVTSENLIIDIKNEHCYYSSNSIVDIKNRHFNNWIIDIKNKGFY